MDDTILPATQTQEYSDETANFTVDEAPRPWGRLASCVPELESIGKPLILLSSLFNFYDF